MANHVSFQLSTPDIYTLDPLKHGPSNAIMHHLAESISSQAPFSWPNSRPGQSPPVIESVVIPRGQTVYIVTKVCHSSGPDEELTTERGHTALNSQDGHSTVQEAQQSVVEVEGLLCKLDTALGVTEGHKTFNGCQSDPGTEIGSYVIAQGNLRSGTPSSAAQHGSVLNYATSDVVHHETALGRGCVVSVSRSSLDCVTLNPPSATLTGHVSESVSLIASKVARRLDDPGIRGISPSDQIISGYSQISAFQYSDHSALSDALDEKIACDPRHEILKTGCSAKYVAPTPGPEAGSIHVRRGDKTMTTERDNNKATLTNLPAEQQLQETPQPPPVAAVSFNSSIAAADLVLVRNLGITVAAVGAANVSSLDPASSSMGKSGSEASAACVDVKYESEEECLKDAIGRLRANRKLGRPGHPASTSSDAKGHHHRVPRKQLNQSRHLHVPSTGTQLCNPGLDARFPVIPSTLKRKREYEEKEEGEITEYEPDSDAEPDVPLATILGSRQDQHRSIPPPPAKKPKITPTEPLRVSGTGDQPRSPLSWEERLKRKYEQAQKDGRKGIRIISPDRQLLAQKMNPEGGGRWRWTRWRRPFA